MTFLECLESEWIAISPATMLPEICTWAEAPPGRLVLLPFQKKILKAVFTKEGVPKYRTIVWSSPKKTGKTAIGAAWIYAHSRVFGGETYCLANAKSQAVDRAFARVTAAISHQLRHNKAWCKAHLADLGTEHVEFKTPYALIQAVPCAPGSQAGGHQSLTHWDELWNYQRDSLIRLFSEMQPIDTIPVSYRLITTYAGYYGESDLLWQIYQDVVKPDPEKEDAPSGNPAPGCKGLPCYVSDDGYTFVYWDHERRMPWQKKGDYETAARNDPVVKLRPSEYQRLHENRWVSGVEQFIDMNVWDQNAAEGVKRGISYGGIF